MMRSAQVLVLFAALAGVHATYFEQLQAGCHSTDPDYGPPNLYPIVNGASSLTFIKSVKNGKLYKATLPHDGGNTTSSFFVAHVWGTPYEQGLAQGQLYGDIASKFISTTWQYMLSEIGLIKHFPVWLQRAVENLGLAAALDLTADATHAYTPASVFEELTGISDGCGVSYRELLQVHMIAGLTQGKCSMIGAWGPALDPNSTTKLLQLRALDWDMDGPFRDYSAMTVYHNAPGQGNSYVSVGMTGFIGGLTGVSSAKLAISEIGASYPDATFGHESRIGMPFIFVLREILRTEQTIDDATSLMANTRRTCDLILGVGDGKLNEFRGYEYSYSVLNVMDDLNLEPYNETWHPRIPGIVYWGMDWICPGYNLVLSNLLKRYYGAITPEIALRYISAEEKSGSNHLAYYDLTNMQMWVSFAAPHTSGGPIDAYQRQFSQWDVNALFAEQPPTDV